MRSALEVVAYVVQSNPTIESVTCVTYAEGSNWPGLPAAGEGVNNELLLKAIQQDRGERMLTQLSRDEGFEQHLRDVIQGFGCEQIVGDHFQGPSCGWRVSAHTHDGFQVCSLSYESGVAGAIARNFLSRKRVVIGIGQVLSLLRLRTS